MLMISSQRERGSSDRKSTRKANQHTLLRYCNNLKFDLGSLMLLRLVFVLKSQLIATALT